jgi:hypothetical protein
VEKEIKYELLIGHHKVGKRNVGPGGVFKATPAQIKSSGMDHRVKCLEPLEAEEVDEQPSRDASYLVVHKGGGRYAVVNEITNERVNDDLLTKEAAQQLADDLHSGEVTLEEEESE